MRCTNIECSVPVSWSDRLGDAMWLHRGTKDRKCADGLTPPLSQRQDRIPGEVAWHCPTCGVWNSVVEDGEGGLKAQCIGTPGEPHETVSWARSAPQNGAGAPQTTPPVTEVRLSPDGSLVALRSGTVWKTSDGSRRTHSQVADWLVLSPGQPSAKPEPAATPEPAETAEAELEYGIQYHYSPGNWHALPNVSFTDPMDAAKAALARNKAKGNDSYRPVQRRAAGTWEPLPLPASKGSATVSA